MFKKSIFAFTLLHMSTHAADIQFVKGLAASEEQAQQFMQEKLNRLFHFSHQRKGVFGVYYSFMPSVESHPVFNLVDSVATDHKGQVFRIYKSTSLLEPAESWPNDEAVPPLSDLSALLALEDNPYELRSIDKGWWAKSDGLYPVWSLTITQTLQGQKVTQRFFISATTKQVIGQRGDLEPYQADQADIKTIYSSVNVKAWIFNPDPKTSLMSETLQHEYDKAVDLPDAAFRLVELKDLTETDRGLQLKGPYAHVIDFAEPNENVQLLPVNETMQSHHSSASFLQQMAYYHIDKAQRHLQKLGFTQDKVIHYGPITVDAQGSYNDQSAYSYFQKRILLGIGGHADAQDADVIWHEYGHSITHFINPYDDGADSGAIGEGYADFLAASHSFRDPQGREFETDIMFNWDARFGQRRPRILNDQSARYNPNYYYPAHLHVAGSLGDQLWSTPLFQSFKEAAAFNGEKGMDDVERIVIEAMYGLGAGVTMTNLALSTLDMAKRMYPDEPYAHSFQSHFSHHNLLPQILLIQQKNEIEHITHDISVVVDVNNISPYPLNNIKFDAYPHEVVKLSSAEIKNMSASENTSLEFTLSVENLEKVNCGSQFKVPVVASFEANNPVLSQSQFDLEITLGKAIRKSASGEGGPLKDAKGEKSGVIHNKGVNNFYLNMGDDEILIDHNFRLNLNLEHHDFSQISIKLISPSGNKVDVWKNEYYPHTRFNFTLPSDIANVDFSAFYGQKLTSEWQLQIVDHQPDFNQTSSSATLFNWGLSQITGYECSVEKETSKQEDNDQNSEKNEESSDSTFTQNSSKDASSGSAFWLILGLFFVLIQRIKYTHEEII